MLTVQIPSWLLSKPMATMSEGSKVVTAYDSPLEIDYTFDGEYWTAVVRNQIFPDGGVSTGVSRKVDRALGYALRQLADELIQKGR